MDEKILPNDYPVHPTYFYVADGNVIRSPVEGTVSQLKRAIGATEIRRCDAVSRGLFND